LAPPAAETPGDAPILARWDRVFVDLDWMPLFSRTVRLRALEIDAPHVRAERRPDGTIDPLAHARPTVPPGEPEPPPAEPEAPGEPWTIAIDAFALREPDVRLVDEESGEVLAELGLERLGLDAIALRGADLALGAVGIAGPVLRVRRDFVLGEGAAPAPAAEPDPEPVAEPASAPATAPAEPPGYRIERIAVERAQFVWLTDPGPLDIALTVEAQGVTAQEGERFPLRVALEIEDGTLEIDGQTGLVPPAFDGQVAWRALPLPPLVRAATPELAGWLRAGDTTASLTVAAHLAPAGDAPPGVRVSGDVAVAGLAAGDPGGEEVSLAWRELAIASREIGAPLPQDGAPPTPTRVALAQVRLDGPDVRYALPTPELDALLGGGAAPADAAEPAEASGAAPGEVAEPAAASAEAPAEPTAEPPPPAASETADEPADAAER